MKKLMFVAVAAASCAAFAAADIPVEDESVFSLTFAEKTIEAKYGEGDVVAEPAEAGDIAYDYETKDDAQKAAEADFEEQYGSDDYVLKGITVKSIREDGVKYWGFQYKYAEIDKDTVKSAKVVTTTVNGLCCDGRVFVWNKADKNEWDKINAYEVTEDFDLQGQPVAKKAVAGFTWGDTNGAGSGTVAKDEDGDYTLVKSISGSIVGKAADDSAFNDLYGTWKFQKDAAATKLLRKGDSIESILRKKNLELVEAE